MLGSSIRRIILAFIPMLLFTCLDCFGSIFIPEAVRWCEENVLHPVEGIWEYPDDGVVVLIRRKENAKHKFEIIVLESEDSRLTNGMILGELSVSPDSGKFRLSHYRESKGGVLSGLFDSAAELTSDGEALRVKAPKVKLRVSPAYILPSFFRMIRLGMERPGSTVSDGMIKIYPSGYVDGFRRSRPRAL